MEEKRPVFQETAAGREILLRRHAAALPGAPLWRDALALGNGVTGALWSAAAGRDTVILTRHDLWAGARQTGELPFLKDALGDMRSQIDRREYRAARDTLARALTDSGYRQTIAAPFPLGEMTLAAEATGPVFAWRRGLRLSDGEGFSSWRRGNALWQRRMFLSRDDGILYWKNRCESKTLFTLSLGPRQSEEPGPHPLAAAITESARVTAEGRFLLFAAQAEGVWFGAAVEVAGPELTVRAGEGTLSWEGCTFTLRLKTFLAEEPSAAFARLQSELSGAPDYETARARHVLLHRPLCESVRLRLSSDDDAARSAEELREEAEETPPSPALYEKLWRFGRHLFASGTAENANPFPLYGLWAGDYDLPWTQNVANENVEMLYWHALPGGFEAAARALLDYYFRQLPAFRENARRLFGCRGIFVPGYTAPVSLNGCASSGPCVAVPVILNWISAAGWLSSHFMQLAEYTQDEPLIRDKVLPFVTETARFYADYARIREGVCELSPSVSPENTPQNLMPAEASAAMEHPCPTVRNATMDFAVMKETLTAALGLCERFPAAVPAEETAQWRRLLAAVPPYAVNGDGAVQEWLAPELEDQYAHRHLSHLYPVFPGSEVLPDGDPALRRAFERAVELRRTGSLTGWSFAHIACIRARLGQGELALDALDQLVKACLQPNFFTVHNDWRHMGASLDLGAVCPVQLDALLGLVNALQEMLLRFCRGRLYVFPAIPRRFSCLRAEDLRIPGARVGLIKADAALRVSLHAERDTKLTLLWPDGEKAECSLSAGEVQNYAHRLPETESASEKS